MSESFLAKDQIESLTSYTYNITDITFQSMNYEIDDTYLSLCSLEINPEISGLVKLEIDITFSGNITASSGGTSYAYIYLSSGQYSFNNIYSYGAFYIYSSPSGESENITITNQKGKITHYGYMDKDFEGVAGLALFRGAENISPFYKTFYINCETNKRATFTCTNMTVTSATYKVYPL